MSYILHNLPLSQESQQLSNKRSLIFILSDRYACLNRFLFLVLQLKLSIYITPFICGAHFHTNRTHLFNREGKGQSLVQKKPESFATERGVTWKKYLFPKCNVLV